MTCGADRAAGAGGALLAKAGLAGGAESAWLSLLVLESIARFRIRTFCRCSSCMYLLFRASFRPGGGGGANRSMRQWVVPF